MKRHTHPRRIKWSHNQNGTLMRNFGHLNHEQYLNPIPLYNYNGCLMVDRHPVSSWLTCNHQQTSTKLNTNQPWFIRYVIIGEKSHRWCGNPSSQPIKSAPEMPDKEVMFLEDHWYWFFYVFLQWCPFGKNRGAGLVYHLSSFPCC